jgi:hypothetical protein
VSGIENLPAQPSPPLSLWSDLVFFISPSSLRSSLQCNDSDHLSRRSLNSHTSLNFFSSLINSGRMAAP